jgi:triphosphatase
LKLGDGRRKTRTLRSIYLDTPEHSLNKAGIALGLWRNGRRWTQIVEMGSPPHGALSPVAVIESPAPGGRPCLETIPDPSVREEVIRHANGSPLQPVCQTVVKRSSSELALEDGTRAELAIDIGEIRAADRAAEFRAAGIELIEGRPGRLFDIAHALFPVGGLQFSRFSLAARGYLLAEQGQIDPPLTPRTADQVALDPAQIAEHAARDVLRECLDQIATNMVVVQKLDDPEGVHQLRVGLRRLRSAFAAFSSVLKSPEMNRLGKEARWLGQEVGRLRDLDVVANEIVQREAEAHPQEPGFPALAEALKREAAKHRECLRTLIVEGRAQAFLIDLARFVETRGWLVPEDFDQSGRLAAPVTELAVAALSKRWSRVRKRARKFKTLNDEQRHELRKELKKLRYAIEFLSPLFPAKRVEPFLKCLKKLQTVFGDLNDAATIKTMFTDRTYAKDNAAIRATGWVIGASQARAEFGWARAQALWRDLENASPFWK